MGYWHQRVFDVDRRLLIPNHPIPAVGMQLGNYKGCVVNTTHNEGWIITVQWKGEKKKKKGTYLVFLGHLPRLVQVFLGH